jgi:preprotein translocase subunit SecG
MLSFFLGLLSVITVLLALFLVIVILLQRSGSNAGMGSAMAGGALDSAFGVATNSVLIRATTYGITLFFALILLGYLGTLYNAEIPERGQPAALPEISLTDVPVEDAVAPTRLDLQTQSESNDQ